jgi:hypothetical protein
MQKPGFMLPWKIKQILKKREKLLANYLLMYSRKKPKK